MICVVMGHAFVMAMAVMVAAMFVVGGHLGKRGWTLTMRVKATAYRVVVDHRETRKQCHDAFHEEQDSLQGAGLADDAIDYIGMMPTISELLDSSNDASRRI
jgi:hypothetical protein